MITRHYLTIEADQLNKVVFTGNFIKLAEAEYPVIINNSQSRILLNVGDWVTLKNFTEFDVINTKDAKNKIVLILGSEGENHGSDANEITGVVKVQRQAGKGLQAGTEEINGEQVFLAANSTRLKVTIKNKSSGIIKVGSSDVSKRFYELDIDEKLIISEGAGDEIKLIADSADQKITYLAEFADGESLDLVPQNLADSAGVDITDKYGTPLQHY
jgi:hypothetical protein